MEPKPAIRHLVRLIEEGFDHRAWHGPNLRGSLRGLAPGEYTWRPATGRHNIWEVMVHTAYWKYAVRRRITGEKRGSFPLSGSDWFPRPTAGRTWKEDLALLEQEHRQLMSLVRTLGTADLAFTPAGSKVTTEAVLRGIALHDVYHAGQIQLLKRLARENMDSHGDARRER